MSTLLYRAMFVIGGAFALFVTASVFLEDTIEKDLPLRLGLGKDLVSTLALVVCVLVWVAALLVFLARRGDFLRMPKGVATPGMLLALLTFYLLSFCVMGTLSYAAMGPAWDSEAAGAHILVALALGALWALPGGTTLSWRYWVRRLALTGA